MTTLEIVLLVLGAVVFIASFVMPETQSELDAVDRQLTKEQIQEMLKEEMKHVHEQVTDVIDETVTYSVEKSERALERLTNDKIQAISEYSGTVLEDIHKNHEETMFLYDMLSDKHENLKETASEVSMAVKEANETVSEVQKSSEQAKAVIDEAISTAIAAEAEEEAFEPMAAFSMERVEKETVIGGAEEGAGTARTATEADLDALLEVLKSDQKPAAKAAKKTAASKTQTAGIAKGGAKSGAKKTGGKKAAAAGGIANDIAIHFDGTNENGNNNEQILALHSQGKSNMAIAKQLGLGVGEVNLVIGLFEENGI